MYKKIQEQEKLFWGKFKFINVGKSFKELLKYVLIIFLNPLYGCGGGEGNKDRHNEFYDKTKAGERILRTVKNLGTKINLNTDQYDRDNIADFAIMMLLTYSNIYKNTPQKKQEPSYQNLFLASQGYSKLYEPRTNTSFLQIDLVSDLKDRVYNQPTVKIEGRLGTPVDGFSDKDGKVDVKVIDPTNKANWKNLKTGSGYENVISLDDLEQYVGKTAKECVDSMLTTGKYKNFTNFSHRINSKISINCQSHHEANKDYGHAYVELVSNGASIFINKNNRITTSYGKELQTKNCALLANLMVFSIILSLHNSENPQNIDENINSLGITSNMEQLTPDLENAMYTAMLTVLSAFGVISIEKIAGISTIVSKGALLLSAMQNYNPLSFTVDDYAKKNETEIENLILKKKEESKKKDLINLTHVDFFCDAIKTSDDIVKYMSAKERAAENQRMSFMNMFTVFQALAVYLVDKKESLTNLDLSHLDKKKYSEAKFFTESRGQGVAIGGENGRNYKNVWQNK